MARSTLKRTWPSGLKLCLLKPGLSHCQCSVRLSARTRPARNLVAVLFLCTLIDIVYESTLHASQHTQTHKHVTRGDARRYSLARSLARKHTHLRSHIGFARGKIGSWNVESCTGLHDRGSWRVLEDLQRTLERWFFVFEKLGGLTSKESSSDEVSLYSIV